MSKAAAVLFLALILQPAWATAAGAETSGFYPAVDVGQDARPNPGDRGIVKNYSQATVDGIIRTAGPTFPLVRRPFH
jgi:hypothetical protein